MRTFTIVAILCACLALTFALELELFSDENCNSGKTITINVGFNDCHGIADKGFELTSYGTGNNTACTYDSSDCKNSTTRQCDTFTVGQCHSGGGFSYIITNSAASTTLSVFALIATISALLL